MKLAVKLLPYAEPAESVIVRGARVYKETKVALVINSNNIIVWKLGFAIISGEMPRVSMKLSRLCALIMYFQYRRRRAGNKRGYMTLNGNK